MAQFTRQVFAIEVDGDDRRWKVTQNIQYFYVNDGVLGQMPIRPRRRLVKYVFVPMHRLASVRHAVERIDSLGLGLPDRAICETIFGGLPFPLQSNIIVGVCGKQRFDYDGTIVVPCAYAIQGGIGLYLFGLDSRPAPFNYLTIGIVSEEPIS